MGTTSGRDRFLAAARGESTDRPPAWMMRQAGRYLPEYREIRADHSFSTAISTPEIATEITLQPWERFRPDGVVMYSDILTALEPLGIPYHMEPGVGPVIDEDVEDGDDLPTEPAPIDETLGYVGEILQRLRERLADRAAVIGFVGGPFTLAAYLIEGEPSRSFMALRRLRYEDPEAFAELLERLGEVLAAFARYQTDHGADVIQLFDTYAGLLGSADYREFLLPIHRRVLDSSAAPTIVFARNMGGRLDLLADSGADVVGLDWSVDLAAARDALGTMPLQGNLDPAALYGTPDAIERRTRDLLATIEGPHILNLGHGVDLETPPEHVAAFFRAVRSSG